MQVFNVLTSAEIFELTNTLSVDYPMMSKVWQFNILFVFVNDPELIKNVLTSEICLEKPSILYQFLHADNGLTAAKCKL